MSISSEIKYRLNRLFGQTPADVQLGTLIEGAYTIDDNAVTASKIAAGAVVEAKIGALAVTSGKIGAGAVTKAKLAAGISGNFILIDAGNFTTAGGDANESITSANCLGTDIAIVNVRTPGAVARTIVSATPGAGSIAVVMSDDPSTDHVLSYIVLRAAV